MQSEENRGEILDQALRDFPEEPILVARRISYQFKKCTIDLDPEFKRPNIALKTVTRAQLNQMRQDLKAAKASAPANSFFDYAAAAVEILAMNEESALQHVETANRNIGFNLYSREGSAHLKMLSELCDDLPLEILARTDFAFDDDELLLEAVARSVLGCAKAAESRGDVTRALNLQGWVMRLGRSRVKPR